ncbi:MAG: response regulator transcription factor [Anaerolineae bacterium]|nr:response regulator transcription factor [Anaerolineae bacterium]
MPPSVRVLLVDDNQEFLKSAYGFLALQPSLQVIGGATSGAEALKQIRGLAPDLVLLDWAMPEMSGVETARLIKAQKDAPRVIILTMYDLPHYRTAAKFAGADGFVNKLDWNKQLMPLVQQLFPDVAGAESIEEAKDNSDR